MTAKTMTKLALSQTEVQVLTTELTATQGKLAELTNKHQGLMIIHIKREIEIATLEQQLRNQQ